MYNWFPSNRLAINVSTAIFLVQKRNPMRLMTFTRCETTKVFSESGKATYCCAGKVVDELIVKRVDY